MMGKSIRICGCEGITRFVNEQVPMPDRLVIHNLNGHAIVIKLGTDSPGRPGR
jgi:hypothetical protein